MSAPTPSRRGVLTGAAALAAAGYVAPAASAATAHGGHATRLTILGTTDLHGNVFNWDYYKNAEYDDSAHNDIGLAKVQTLIKAQRARLAGQPLLMLDAGDTIQGTPLAYYYAKVEPITSGGTHPMAACMNLIGYDAAALGNHEFNYGIPLLRAYEKQLNFPLLGANAVDPASGLPVFPPYVLKTIRMPEGPDIKVGILGLTNPGIAIWDRDNVSGRIDFPGLVEQAAIYVPQLKKLGCDIVVVAAHSGASTSSSYGDALPYPENASSLVAEQVPDIDAILVGHAHVDIPQKFVTNTATGRQVLLCEPDYWGMRLAVMELDLVRHGHRWSVALRLVADPQLQRRGRGRRGRRGGPRPARQGRRLRQHRDRHLHPGDVGRPGPGRGRPDHRLRQLRPGGRREAGPHRCRRRTAGAVDRCAVQPQRLVPGRRREPA